MNDTIWMEPSTRRRITERDEKRLRAIRRKVFDYDDAQYQKAARIIDQLKDRIISLRPKPPVRHWMFACE